ncbi:sigma 54-interacting transcriptional regulator [Desulforhabdus sp. TSK]|uniref:sigma 54-interacting transcriptional regulator n=1 Tax=Desulforhabdus sp. TSK TaxID=2925014 RepID=UPI001FC8A818|nr:sigma 54-interacting transcriptional regulator [Desulforhabdus sp. TSK]GKT09999.1 hypothetical protein DSTSK_33040 [Desulforhabdus sp. TSK]
MSFFQDVYNESKPRFFGISNLRSLRIRTKLLFALIPLTILILIATGFITNWFSSQFLNEAIQRNVRLQTLALGHEVEIFLNQCKEDLLELRHGPVTELKLIEFWKSQKAIRGWEYAGLAYLSENISESIYLVSKDGTMMKVSYTDIPLIRPDPRNLLEKLQASEKDSVWLSPVIEGVYPLTSDLSHPENIAKKVIRLATHVLKEDGSPNGVLLLAVSVYQLRDILSRFNSTQSPIFAFIRSPELRYSFFFDTDGWTWFQSEEAVGKDIKLSTETARSGFSGTFGKPGLPSAFRPFPEHLDYWRMVKDVQQGKSGLITLKQDGSNYPSMAHSFYMGYTPVRFVSGPDMDPIVFAGVGLVDRSRLGLWAGYRQVDVIFIIALGTTFLISLFVYILSRVITRPILDLAAAVNRIQETGQMDEISLSDHDYETSFLKYSINKMLATIRYQVEEIRLKDESLLEAAQRETAKLEEEIRALKQHFCFHDIKEIVGMSPAVEALRVDILKVGAVDADVLILGETGTGKQLTAEAIHRISHRSIKPFVSINCGALDESLLLDELFGHVKGAFTEAKWDRKGAFLAADGGTLFLDEIGTASPKVQQTLLRAISMRRVAPLGSDREYDVDVRLLAATNEDLKNLVETGRFREDLYYRLNVVTIRTPALRDHMEDVPLLLDHFLKEASREMHREYMDISRGALNKIKTYRWPGNVRELKNCITRAVAMAESSVIQEVDIRLELEGNTLMSTSNERSTQSHSFSIVNEDDYPLPPGVQLNERQKKALPVLLKNGQISRSEYQTIVGNGFPTRTAAYDLQELVKRGVVVMIGRGPATRYKLVKPQRVADQDMDG